MLLLGIRIVHPVQEITIQLTAFLSGGPWHLCRKRSITNSHIQFSLCVVALSSPLLNTSHECLLKDLEKI